MNSTRKPSGTQTALAWVSHALMFGFGYVRDGHRPKRARHIRTLVFVHGLAANRAGFLPLQTYLRLKGHRRQLTFNYRSSGSIESIALRLRRHIDEHVKGGRIDLVAHSMGGLVARYYVQKLGGARRVDRIVTLGTPHRGTTAASLAGSLNLGPISQLDPDGAFLRELNGMAQPDVDLVAFAAQYDGIVRPVEFGFAPFGERVLLEGLGHLDMLLAPRVFARVEACIRRRDAADPVESPGAFGPRRRRAPRKPGKNAGREPGIAHESQ